MNSLERLLTITTEVDNRIQKVNFIREYLQTLILLYLQKSNWFNLFAFTGGTCLRLCYQLARFSEDLDFIVIKKNITTTTVEKKLNLCRELLAKSGFNVRLTALNVNTNIWKCFIVFHDVLYLGKVSRLKSENLRVKIEIDVNPPKNYFYNVGTAASYGHHIMVHNIIHGALSSMFGGKIHAFLYREFTKGRDIYDLEWYLSNNTPLNISIVENTEKTLGRTVKFSKKVLIEQLLQKLQQINMVRARKDVEPFVESPDILNEIFNKERLRILINQIKFWCPADQQVIINFIKKFAGSADQKDLLNTVENHYRQLKNSLEDNGYYLSETLDDSKDDYVKLILAAQ